MSSGLDAFLGVVLGKATADPRERRNLFWIIIAYLLNGAGAALFGGDLWNGFLQQTGFNMGQIGQIMAASMAAGTIGLVVFMGLADRLKHRVRTASLCILLVALAPLLTVGISLAPRVAFPLATVLVTLIVVMVFQALVNSITFMLDYPIWARAITPGVRGKLFGLATASYGVLGIGLGWLSASVLKQLAYPQGYAWCFLAAGSAIALRAASYSRVRELPELAVDGASTSVLPFASIIRVLKLKEFQWLAGPHVARGLGSAVMGFAIPVGLTHLHLPEYYPGYAVSVTTAATVLGGVAVAAYADRLGAAWTTLLGDTLFAAGMATLMLLGGNPLVFLGIYLITHFGRSIEDNSVPLGAINIVPPEHLGAFSAARLMVLLGSGALGAWLFGRLFDLYSPGLLFGLGAALKLLTGLWFFYVFNLKPPVRVPVSGAKEDGGSAPGL